MKKLLHLLITTGFCVPCYGFSIIPEQNCGLNSASLEAPSFRQEVYIGFTGAWLQPTISSPGLNSIDLGTTEGANITSRSTLINFDPDYSWGWGFTVGYNFPATANNLELNYLHLDTKTTLDNTTNGFDSFETYFVPNYLFPVGDPSDVTAALPIVILDNHSHSELKNQFNQFDLKFGRLYHDHYGPFQFQPSFGLRYAKVDHNYRLHSDSELFDALVPAFINDHLDIHNDSEYDGIGPLLTLEGRYGFCHGLGITAHIEAALMIGQIDDHLNVYLLDDQLADQDGAIVNTTLNHYHIHKATTDRVVTNLAARIGVDYGFCFCKQSSLTFELGYMASKYYNAIDLLRGTIRYPAVLVPDEFNNSVTQLTDTNTCSYELHGPYLNVTCHI